MAKSTGPTNKPAGSPGLGEKNISEELPRYTATGNDRLPSSQPLPSAAVDELTSAFSSLNLPSWTEDVNPDTCLAHLKLLSAFQSLKEDVGYTDGLWDLFDARVLQQQHDVNPKAVENGLKLDDEAGMALARLREKRWALFVARAVDRYEAWWRKLSKSYLTELDFERDSERYGGFTYRGNPLSWGENILPPLDVLMVWHAHMLNPRAFLEDCMLHCLNGLWTAGMPWKLVNHAIDTSFNYNVSKECKNAWENIIGRKWDNADDPMTKTLKCPTCSETNEIPWTTCGVPENFDGKDPGLLGEGYGDGNFVYTCTKCKRVLTREFLAVTRFVKDVQDLLSRHRPMPGTVLDNKTGLPKVIPRTAHAQARFERTFPNRLIKKHLRSKLLELTAPEATPAATMDNVRLLIEEALKNDGVLKEVDEVSGRDAIKRYRLGGEARAHTRRMMSRYWDNPSPFALELGGAVLRQGVFTEKMNKIDWLHSPAARSTVSRLIKKYERFVRIMTLHPQHVVVPTLDVDLAWHTQQLSPPVYTQFMWTKTQQLVDHDDKIDEDKLSSAFEWTSRTYQETYGEVYSECTCWYCESIRAAHVSSVGSILGVSRNEKTPPVSESFYLSGRASLCPPNNSAHISAHNAVRTSIPDARRDAVHRRLSLAHHDHLDRNYARARRRARRRGRNLPPRDEYYGVYWGYPYALYGPYVSPVYPAPGCYPGGDPGTKTVGSGGQGACVAGCGGGSGGCSGPGGNVADILRNRSAVLPDRRAAVQGEVVAVVVVAAVAVAAAVV
ncbi:hypothetical protein AAE478_009769 [Parahypoxylon ruwenzoriense]